MIGDAQAVRIARRLARHYRHEDRLLRRGMVTRLWSLLETHHAAREAYACPPGRTLIEHGSRLAPDELERAVDRLKAATRSVVTTGEAG